MLKKWKNFLSAATTTLKLISDNSYFNTFNEESGRKVALLALKKKEIVKQNVAMYKKMCYNVIVGLLIKILEAMYKSAEPGLKVRL